MSAWIVVNIGCIECGVSSNIVGVFDDKEIAEKLADDLGDCLDWREGGQNGYQVFPMPVLNTIGAEYGEALSKRTEA